ncbi:hypothetical protein O9G_001645 [Rozella allomycis CSF55]|uniref:Uncharacterized protein n=1 Tax=Rozella allomycis (strain CSF55) TaxID=988480 RepID=A0A075AX58_ROZAC|nr:hypothetical protein O9G_001645 [Rozella allomycis CSF55]|eukprot:EPZ34915.1 hypothetical protein O9G_001645 [Rozella allomycis CSF55]
MLGKVFPITSPNENHKVYKGGKYFVWNRIANLPNHSQRWEKGQCDKENIENGNDEPFNFTKDVKEGRLNMYKIFLVINW